MYDLKLLESVLNKKWETEIHCRPDQWPELAKALGKLGYVWAHYPWNPAVPVGENPEYPHWYPEDICFIKCFSNSKTCMRDFSTCNRALPCELFLESNRNLDIQQIMNLF